jgi:hypothetical protein
MIFRRWKHRVKNDWLSKLKSKSFLVKLVIYGFILLLPFLVFYWQVPFLSNLTIGNDYKLHSIAQQMELQYSLERGSFPLYVRGYAGGQASAALTLGQLFHPISHLSAALPGYWHGKALQWNTFWRLFFLGLCHLGLFILLCRLRLSGFLSFIISFITVYNLRMLDLFRYGASLENYTGYLFLCTAAAFYYIKPTRFSGPISIIAATYLLVCGGHPQMMYYSLLGAGMAVIVIPFVLDKISDDIKTSRPYRIKYFITTGTCMVGGILLSSAYTIPFYFDFLASNAQRVGQIYKWSIQYSDTIGGMLNSFFSPLHGDVHGAFGSSAIILLIALVPLLYLAGKKVPMAISLVWVLLTFTFLCSLGTATPVYYFFWKYFPFARDFRVPGRIVIIFPFLFLLILAWLFRSPGKKVTSTPGTKSLSTSPYRFLAIVAIPLFILYNQLLAKYLPKPGPYTPGAINPSPQWVGLLIFCLGLLSLILVLVHSFYIQGQGKKWHRIIGVLLVITVVLQVTAEIRYGTWVIKKRPQPTLEKMDNIKKKDLTYFRSKGGAMESAAVFRQMRESILEPALAKFYRKYKSVSDQTGAYRILNKENVTDTLVVETTTGWVNSLEHNANHSKPNDRIRLEENTFNRVLFSVEAGAPGFLAFSFPYSDKWKAMINGNSTRVYRANGYMQAVYLEAGQHKVEFRYWSRAAFAGTLVSCFTFLLIGSYFVFFVLGGKQRVIGAAVSVLVPVCLFLAWTGSLYSGENLGTQYTWSSKEFPSRNNLAYAKKSTMDRPRSSFYAGLGVDGEIGTPFRTRKRKKGWWQVDLGSTKLIGEIVIYDGQFQGRKNLPLQILGSLNGKTFKPIKTLKQRSEEQPWRISLGKEITRFVRLQSSTKIPLSFNEVEIYPSPGFHGKDITPQNLVDFLMAKTVISPGDKEIRVWNRSGLTAQEISPMLIPFAKWGTFKIDPVVDNGINMLRVRVIEPDKDGIRKLHLGYEFNRNGLNAEIPEGKTIHLIVRAAISPNLLNRKNFIGIQDFDRRWKSSRTYFQSPDRTTYHVSKKVRPGVKRLVLFIKFTPRSSTDYIILEEVRLLVQLSSKK